MRQAQLDEGRSTIDKAIKGDGKESQKIPVEDTGEGQWASG